MKIGEKIRQLRKAKKMTILELANAVGSDVGNISRLERGVQGYSDAIIRKIADALMVPLSELFSTNSVDDIAGMQGGNIQVARRADVYRVDVLNVTASAGNGASNSEIVEVVKSIEYLPEHARMMFGGRPEGSVMLVNVSGDSMSGTFEPGDLIFVDITVRHFDGDGIYIFNFAGDTFVKRLQKVKYELKVISDNKSYETWSIDAEEIDQLYIEGKVLISQSQSFCRHG